MWQDEFIKLNQKGVRYVFPKEIERAEVLDISNFADFVQKRDESVVKAMKEFGFRLPEKTESLNDYFMELENVHQIDEKGAAESNTGKNQTIEKEINGTKYTMTIVNDKTSLPYAILYTDKIKSDTEMIVETLNSRFINSLRYYKENDYNIKAKIYRGIGHKGIFDSRMNPFAGVVISDIRNFYENGEGFLQDNTSTNRIDMSEQTRREKRNEHSNEANISDYE